MHQRAVHTLNTVASLSCFVSFGTSPLPCSLSLSTYTIGPSSTARLPHHYLSCLATKRPEVLFYPCIHRNPLSHASPHSIHAHTMHVGWLFPHVLMRADGAGMVALTRTISSAPAPSHLRRHHLICAGCPPFGFDFRTVRGFPCFAPWLPLVDSFLSLSTFSAVKQSAFERCGVLGRLQRG